MSWMRIVANVAMVLALAPLFEGLVRKLTARFQSRQGPPIWQAYYDLFKLLGKEDLEFKETAGLQRLAAGLALAAPLTVAALAPMGTPPPLAGAADVLLLVYLLTVCSLASLLAGLAAGSTYSLIGISREMMTLITLEPLLAVALVIGSVHTHSLQLETILSGSVYAPQGFPGSGLLVLVVLLGAFPALLHRLPFDVAEAETEIMEGPLLEYSGPKLALFKLAHSVKLVTYSALVVALFMPWGRTGLYPVDLVVFLLKVSVLVVGVTWAAALFARYRIDQALRYYAGLFAVALVALVLAVNGF